MIAVQSTVPAGQISIAVSLLSFSQSLGQAIFLTLGQVMFIGSLESALRQYAPSVVSGDVIAAGAGSIRSSVPKTEIGGVLMAYSHGIDHVFYLATGIAICCFCVAWGMGWKNIQKRNV